MEPQNKSCVSLRLAIAAIVLILVILSAGFFVYVELSDSPSTNDVGGGNDGHTQLRTADQLLEGLVSRSLNFTIHIAPHSHCDAGWQVPAQNYYRTKVARILSSVTDAVTWDHSRRFSWSETLFLRMWWDRTTEAKREEFRRAVARGQIQFIGGGMVQSDEAVAHWSAVIEQMTDGHMFLAREFGVVPTTAWQVDSFGSSSLTPFLNAQMGFDTFVHARVDTRLKEPIEGMNSSGMMSREREFEYLWTPVAERPDVKVFGVNLPRGYCGVKQYCEDIVKVGNDGKTKNKRFCVGFDFGNANKRKIQTSTKPMLNSKLHDSSMSPCACSM